MPVYMEKKEKWAKDGRRYFYKCQYTDRYGNRKQKKSKLFLKKDDAKTAERKFLESITMIDEINYDVSFGQVYYEWLEYKKQVIKSTTYYSTQKKANKNILEELKDYKLKAIKENVLMNWRQTLLQKKLSEGYQNTIIGYMQEILAYAIDNYNFDKKIANKLRKKKIESVQCIKKDSENNFWTYQEFQTFLKYVDNELDKKMYNFLYYTGLRLGEMIALNWNDIDFSRKTVSINKTFTNKLVDKEWDIISPKTSNSIREIDLDDDLIDILKAHKQSEEKIYGFNNNFFVFGNIIHISPTTFTKHLKKYIEKSGVKKITPHGFRHSHASLLIYLGCDSRDVAARLGDTVQVIESTYYHLFPDKKKATINKLNQLKNK